MQREREKKGWREINHDMNHTSKIDLLSIMIFFVLFNAFVMLVNSVTHINERCTHTR